LLQSKTLLIEHAIGSLTKHRFLWRTVHCSNHSATRRYYITRNQLEFYSRSLFFEPRLALWGFANLALRSALTLLYETDRAAKAGAIARGAWHFATRRFGRL
jgi:rhamnosyltransferase